MEPSSIIFLENSWIEILWITIAGILLIIGIIGCIVPVIPGPPLSFFGLLILQLLDPSPFTIGFMLLMAFITIIVTIIDYMLPVWGARKFGSSRWGIFGSILGLIIGLFIFPPIGIFIFPFVGAFLMEFISGKETFKAFRASIGVFLGFIIGSVAKVIVSGYMFWKFLEAVF